MNTRYTVKTILAENGERIPMLLGYDGLPLFDPTVFSLTEVRSRNRASNTIDSYLRSIMVLLLFLDFRNINLEERLASGFLLSLVEIEELVGICMLPVKKIHSMIEQRELSPNKIISTVASIEKFRKKQKKSTKSVYQDDRQLNLDFNSVPVSL